ncbi:MAG: ion transporter [Bacteroidota bacterium]|nr:ion transporter [Bacteroidota bacterium]
MKKEERPENQWRRRLHEIIFEADTTEGKTFDVALIILILASIFVVMLESVRPLDLRFHKTFSVLEWIFTVLFSIEYILRILSVKRPIHYIWSFYGVIDLLSVLPTYLSLFLPGSQFLLVTRSLRLLRIFRVFKLTRFVSEANILKSSLAASRRKITVFLFAVFLITIIMGTVMYLVEGGQNGFTSIPRSIYWCIVTLTTVGYGDISPTTVLGQFIASFIMILGYGIIAVPTGLITVEMTRQSKLHTNTQSCPNCGYEGHRDNAEFCYHCGHSLHS